MFNIKRSQEKQKQGKHGPLNQLEVGSGSLKKRPSSVDRSYPPCAFLSKLKYSVVIQYMIFGLHFSIMHLQKASCLKLLRHYVLYFFVETHIPNNSTSAVNWNNYQNVSRDGKQPMLMIGIGVLAAVVLFIVTVIFYTYRLENVNKETGSNIYFSVK